MQEIIRQYYDEYAELEEEGENIEPPLILRIPKGKGTASVRQHSIRWRT
jgi:hypothetical protein